MSSVVLEVESDGSFKVKLRGKTHYGQLDRDAVTLSPEKAVEWDGQRPATTWDREAIAQAVSFLVGLLPRE